MRTRLPPLRHHAWRAILVLLLADAYPAEPLDDAALGKLVAAGRAELEAALPARRAGTPIDARPGTPVDAALGAIGVPPRLRAKAAAIFDALPRFDDTSGAALNAAAAQLVEGTGRNLPRGGAAPPLPTLRAAEFADGLWKYVLLEVTDAGGASRRLARNYADLAYHAEMAKEATRRELGGYPNVTVRGGGRVRFSAARRTIEIYGYSKTYGRCRACNKEAAALAEASYPGFAVTWSNEGY